MSGRVLPTSIGRYQVRGLLGAGGMGTVFRAHDPVIDRPVAIKVVRTEALEDDSRAAYLDRFRTEAQAAGRCSHPGIVAVYDVSDQDGDPYIVMELVEGRSLQQALRAPGGRAALAPAGLLLQVLAALGFAHGLGVTHRDIKPANIIVTAAGQTKIADFGIARLTEGSVTQVGDMLGTPSYMAPEQVAATDVDHRADLFAVGAVLYELLTGRPPFVGRSASETLLRLAGPDPASMVPVEAAGAGAYTRLLQRALAKPREARFQSAADFAAALQAASTSPPPPAPAYDEATVLMRRGGAGLGTGGIGTGAIGTGGGAGRWDATVLARVERALAQYVGPVARVMVAQAARESASPDALFQALARSLQSAADRSAFLRSLGGGRMEPTLGPRLRTQPSSGADVPPDPVTSAASGALRPPAGPAPGIPADAIAAAQAALAVFAGPIARVLARQAAEQAASPHDFIERLCAHVTKSADALVLRRRLRAEVEPKLR